MENNHQADHTDAAVTTNTLIQKHLTITTMESCTSGLIASMLTDTEGASAVYHGGYVTYSNDAKIAAGVDASIIDTYGVYSKECAQAMAAACQKAFQADIAVGITGSTGNIDVNNTDSVKGEVYYCILCKGKEHSYHYRTEVANKTRHEIKQEYADQVFHHLRQLLEQSSY